MKYINKFKEFINEMAIISKRGRKIYADDKLLKNVEIDTLSNNIGFMYIDKSNMLFGKGQFWFYFLKDPSWIDSFEKSEADLLLFPFRSTFNFNSSPITDIWKKNHTKNIRKSDLIIGIIEGFHNKKDNEVYVRMMSTRPGYKRNTVNRKLIDNLVKTFDTETLIWEDPTEAGLEFIKKYTSTPNFRFTTRPPKNFKKYYPELYKKQQQKKSKGKKSQHIGFDL